VKTRPCDDKALRESARGQTCQVRLPGVCCGDPDKVILAHLPGAGWALKSLNIHAAFCCSDCHLVVDAPEHRQDFLEGMVRTQVIWCEMGLLRGPE